MTDDKKLVYFKPLLASLFFSLYLVSIYNYSQLAFIINFQEIFIQAIPQVLVLWPLTYVFLGIKLRFWKDNVPQKIKILILLVVGMILLRTIMAGSVYGYSRRDSVATWVYIVSIYPVLVGSYNWSFQLYYNIKFVSKITDFIKLNKRLVSGIIIFFVSLFYVPILYSEIWRISGNELTEIFKQIKDWHNPSRGIDCSISVSSPLENVFHIKNIFWSEIIFKILMHLSWFLTFLFTIYGMIIGFLFLKDNRAGNYICMGWSLLFLFARVYHNLILTLNFDDTVVFLFYIFFMLLFLNLLVVAHCKNELFSDKYFKFYDHFLFILSIFILYGVFESFFNSNYLAYGETLFKYNIWRKISVLKNDIFIPLICLVTFAHSCNAIRDTHAKDRYVFSN
ncbi:MAG: hypothetical protein COA79_05120 [Planctomycetota bacterium]|nr:MAG: hypothetical protein COA79_05120 [Planctomycetota bacterium]